MLTIVNTPTAFSLPENKLAISTIQASDSLSGNIAYSITSITF